MSPVSFLQKPLRWLTAIHRYRGTNSGGPDFAYELCVERIPPENREQLDLSSWRIAFNGAEPIRRTTLARFWHSFHQHGFRWEAFRGAYGLAEATVFVSGGPVESRTDDRPVGCGNPDVDTQLRIVDPELLIEMPDGEVGEIWIRSPSVARGYWNRAEETERTFSARLAGSGEGPYVRTGDMGYLAHGELFVTGRLKDLVIVRGRKVYPQDIEQTVESSHDLILPNATAAIAVPTDQGERLVIIAEVQPTRPLKNRGDSFAAKTDAATQQNLQDVIGTIRQVVAEQHELQTCGIVLISRGSIPKTSSGKIQRHACRHGFVAGTLDCVLEWTMPPLTVRMAGNTNREPACR
jgi:acyl-CoA synthetase (AMP-forming)/AMP-acid ligase II